MARRRKRTTVRFWGWTVVIILAGAVGYGGYHHLVAASAATLPPRAPSPPPTRSAARKPAPLPQHYLIHVPGIDQYPQLPNGCEVTGLAMMMDAAGHPVSKMTLAAKMPKDPTPLQLTSTTNTQGQVVHQVKYWGNPNVGFVGSVYRAGDGYGIYHGPMAQFLNRLLPGRAEDLTGDSFNMILRHVAEGTPVEVWTTTTFKPTTDWVTWQSPTGLVKATPWEHAVLVVGYKPGIIYVNNPLNGEAAEPVAEGPFLQSWRQLGKQAITYRSSAAPAAR